MIQNKKHLCEILKNWLYETIEEHYLDEIDNIIDENNDRIYEIIDIIIGDQLYINYNRYDYIIEFFTEEELHYMTPEDTELSDTYTVIFSVMYEMMLEHVETLREYLRTNYKK